MLEKTLESPLDSNRSNQSLLKEINPEYSLEGLMLKLKLQCFGHLMQRAYSLEKTLMMGKIEGRRRKGRQRMRWLDGVTDFLDMSLSKFWEMVKDSEGWRAAVHGLKELDTTKWLNNNGFSSSHVQMWELEHKKCWVPNNWCFQIMALEESLESPLDNKEIKPVNLKGNQPWTFFGRTMAKADLQ